MTADEVPAHDQTFTHRYRMRYPSHEPRHSDPHYIDFEHYHREHRATARCFVGQRIGYGDCKDAQGNPCPPPDGVCGYCAKPIAGEPGCYYVDGGGEVCESGKSPTTFHEPGIQPGLELHHSVIEDALINGVDFAALEVDYPGISNPDVVGAWAQQGNNLRWLCAWHHRGAGGAHTASHSDWTAGLYVPGLISEAPRKDSK